METKQYTDKEVWKDFEEGGGYYQISSHGRLKRLPCTVEVVRYGKTIKRNYSERMLKLEFPDRRSVGSTLSVNGVPIHIAIAVIVAREFIGKKKAPNQKVAHKDGVFRNNHYTNLYYATGSEIGKAKSDRLEERSGFRSARAKLDPDKIRRIRKMAATGDYTHRELGSYFSVCSSIICRIIHRNSWKHVE